MGLESKFWNKLGFILILAHFPATWELKIWKFSNFGQNHFSDFETPFLAGLIMYLLMPFLPHITENIIDYLVLYFLSWNPQNSNSSKIGQSVRIKGLPPTPKLELGLSI